MNISLAWVGYKVAMLRSRLSEQAFKPNQRKER